MPLSAKGQGCKERAQPEQPAADGLPSTRSPQDWQLAQTLQRQAASTWAANAGGGDDGVAVLVITSAILAAIAGKLFTQARARHAKATTLHSEQEAEAWLALAEAILGGALHRIQRTH